MALSYYDADINKNILILMADLNAILEVLNWERHDIKDKTNPSFCQANCFQQEDFTNTGYFAYLTHKFDLEEFKTY